MRRCWARAFSNAREAAECCGYEVGSYSTACFELKAVCCNRSVTHFLCATSLHRSTQSESSRASMYFRHKTFDFMEDCGCKQAAIADCSKCLPAGSDLGVLHPTAAQTFAAAPAAAAAEIVAVVQHRHRTHPPLPAAANPCGHSVHTIKS